jgi:hypothetical protein
MNLRSKLTKIGLYTLSHDAEALELPYVVVGGLAVQIYSHSQFQEYLRPTLDADVLIPNMPFKDFKRDYGSVMGKTLKNKFDIGYHIRNSQNANTVQLIDEGSDFANKGVFLLHMTRYQDPLYERIADKLKQDMSEGATKVPLHDIDITDKTVYNYKAKIRDTDELELRVLHCDEVRKRKLNKILDKATTLSVEVSPEYETVRETILDKGLSYKMKRDIDNLYESILRTYTTDSETYNVEKDIYDFCLLTKIDS